MEEHICQYGCGKKALFQMTSGKWCCENFYSKCIEVRKKNSEKTTKRLLGLYGSKHPHYGKHHSEETKKKLSDKKIGNNNPMKRKEVSKKCGLSKKGKKCNTETRNKMSKSKLGEKNHFYGKKHTFETKIQISKKVRDLYKNPEFLEKYYKGLSKVPNKPESFLINLLDKLFPAEYEYVGNFKLWINGKNPDFINKHKNKIIEFFGDYWHKGEDERTRIDHFERSGYKTLVIWENELNNLIKLYNRIISFDGDFFVHESCYIDENVRIGKGTKIWNYSHILSNVKIGTNCTIGQGASIGPNVTIGDNCKIQNNVSIYEGVILHNNVFVGPSAVFTNVINPRAFINKKNEFKITLVREGSTIGANATIVCGHTIGEYAMVGAGSVVTKDVLDYSLVVGNPAEHLKYVDQNGNENSLC